MCRRIAALVWIVLLAGVGCRDLPPYTCKGDVFCVWTNDIQGICVDAPDGEPYCAFPASDCPSTWRWSERAAEAFANECVDPALVPRRDGGADGMGGDTN